MFYSSFGMLVLVLHFIINFDTFRKRKNGNETPGALQYRRFLACITVYYVSDIIWGLLYERQLTAVVYADTEIYFAAMALSVLLWCRFAVKYLNRDNVFSRILTGAGWLILAFETIVLVLNLFIPFLFWFDAENVYHPGIGRNITLVLQVMLFLFTSLYTLVIASRSRNGDKRHHRCIGYSGLIITAFILLQATDAFVPYYAIGFLIATCLVHIFIVVDEKWKNQRELQEAAQREKILSANRYDRLTGLPNLNWFFEQAEKCIPAIRREGSDAALLYVDLNGMKFFNHRNGFTEGDQLLKSLAGALSDWFGKEQCAHIAGDRFAVFTKADGLEEQLEALFERTGQMNGGKVLPVCVGIYTISGDGIPVTDAYDRAKIACDGISKSDVSRFSYYSKEMRERRERRDYIRANIDRAIREKWIQVYFQPIVRAVSRKICHVEALARWNDPNEGFLSPAEFIPDLEDAGMIYKLDLCMLDQVLENIRKEEEAGMAVVPHSINLSRSDFEACDIVEEIRKRVDDAGVRREQITIEITESIIGSDFEFMKGRVARFRELGFPVWMDDFGSGYSSLDVLQNIRFDLIKFDMSFARKLDEGENAKIILTELMKMVTSIGIDTVCEGVETENQARFLEEIGCSKLQGYHFSKPLPFPEIAEQYRKGLGVGFENPAESDYFEAIGRVNLNDLDVIASGEDSLQNKYNSLPMGIIEISGDRTRFIRSNEAYRDFIRRFFGGSISETTQEFVPYRSAFMRTIVKNCCEQGSRFFYDEKMPDGSMAHAFARRISSNPVTGNKAVAIAVLSVSDPVEGESYADIARALAADYYNIYVVELGSEKYIEYSSPVGQDDLAEERHGTDFFDAVRRDTMTRIFPDDRDLFLDWFTKENVIRELEENGVFTTTYRLIDTGTPVYASLKVTRLDDDRIILGVSVVDSQMKQMEQENHARRERDALARVMAVTDDYIALYSIDPESGAYIEYTSSDDYGELDVAREGDDFFSRSAEEGKKHIYPEDLDGFLRGLTKENVEHDTGENGVFKMHYRLILKGEPQDVSLKIVPYSDSAGKRLFAGVRRWAVRNAKQQA